SVTLAAASQTPVTDRLLPSCAIRTMHVPNGEAETKRQTPDRSSGRSTPTSVIPPRTGAVGSESVSSIPAGVLTVPLQRTLPWTVDTPGIEKRPSAPALPDTPRHVTTVPGAGLPALSTTNPVTVVPGSGMTWTSAGSDDAALPARSLASARIASDVMPT